METKQLFAPFEFKFDDDDEDSKEGKFTGFGSVYNYVDYGMDIVMPGAFKKDLAKKKPQDIKMLWQHSSFDPIGRYDGIKDKGKEVLQVDGAVFKEIRRGKEAYVLMKRGGIDGLSIGYSVSPKGYDIDDKTGVRKIHEAVLREVSIVTFPMNDKATIQAVKQQDRTSVRFWEKHLKEMGFSNNNAMIGAGALIKALENRWDIEATFDDEKSAINFEDPELRDALRDASKAIAKQL